jgi:hypothetical protein
MALCICSGELYVLAAQLAILSSYRLMTNTEFEYGVLVHCISGSAMPLSKSDYTALSDYGNSE